MKYQVLRVNFGTVIEHFFLWDCSPLLFVFEKIFNVCIREKIKTVKNRDESRSLVPNYFEIGQGNQWLWPVSATCDFRISHGTCKLHSLHVYGCASLLQSDNVEHTL